MKCSFQVLADIIIAGNSELFSMFISLEDTRKKLAVDHRNRKIYELSHERSE